jgi:succinate-semialdehyde dehydrogenase / glutarate-semialdehyde dehydrogenase
MTYQSLNPATGKLLKKFEELTDKELESKIAVATTCFETWRRKTYAERAVIVAEAATIMHAKADEFAHTMTLEMGKRINEARGEVEFSANILSYYAKNAERFLAHRVSAKLTWRAVRSAWFSVWSPGTFPITSLPGSPVRI